MEGGCLLRFLLRFGAGIGRQSGQGRSEKVRHSEGKRRTVSEVGPPVPCFGSRRSRVRIPAPRFFSQSTLAHYFGFQSVAWVWPLAVPLSPTT
jgi:hypothetical protein